MFDSLAILQSEIDLALGHLDRKYLNPENVTAAIIAACSHRGMQAAQSQYGRVSKHVQFFPASRDAPVNRAVDMALPSYIERRISNPPNEQWQIVHAVHPSALSENADYRSAWYKDEGGYRLQLNYDPKGIYHRLWYYADPKLAQAFNDPLGIPTRHGYLLLHDSILKVIPSIMLRNGQLPEKEQLSLAMLGALRAQISQSQAERDELELLWMAEKDASKAPRGRNRRPVLGRMGLG